MSEPATTAPDPTAAPPFSVAEAEDALRRSWKFLLAAGILSIAAGILAVLLPLESSIAAATIFGVLLLFAAGALVADAFAVPRHVGRLLFRLLLALLYVVSGIYLIAAPLSGTVTLTFVLGLLFLVEGSMRIAVAIADRRTPARGWQVGSGLLTILLGALILATWPSSSAWAIGTLLGINLVFWGWNMIALGLAGRRIAAAERRAPEPSPA